MNTHPYVRAYLAGIAAPTMFMLVILALYVGVRYVAQVPFPLERGLVFPMALVPNIFGAWNMYYHRLSLSHKLSIGVHGAILPAFMMPIGYEISSHLGLLQLEHSGMLWFGELHLAYGSLVLQFFAAIIIYYLVWKHIVSFFNRVVGLA